MKHIFKRIIPLPLLVAVLLLAAAALLACGPATQAEPEGQPDSQAVTQAGEPDSHSHSHAGTAQIPQPGHQASRDCGPF